MLYHPDYIASLDFSTPERYAALLDYLKEIGRHPDYPQLRKQISLVEQWLAANPGFALEHPAWLVQLQHLLVQLKWIALPAWTYPEPILELFGSHINDLFQLPEEFDVDPTLFGPSYVLTEGLRTCLTNISLWKERDLFKDSLRHVLMNNPEVMTTAKFFRGLKEAPATLKDWFGEYTDFMLTEPFIPERQNTFFKANDNAKLLTPEQQTKLRLLFNVYERLRLPSVKVNGIEEEVSFETDEGLTGKMQYGILEADDPKQAIEYKQFMKDYKDIMIESGLYDAKDIMSMVEDRPGISLSQSIRQEPDIAATAGPDHFAASDETEIQRHEEEVAALSKPTKSEADYLQVASDIKQSVALAFATPEQDKRFTDLIVSVLRGLRDTMELKEYLVDLSFPTSDADAVVAAVNQQIVVTPKLVSDRRAGKIPAPKLAGKPTLAQITKTTDLSPVPSLAREGWPEAGERSVARPASPASGEGTTGERSTFLPKLRRSRTQKRQIIDDVRLQPSMVMSPIDELRAMDTLEFRRLSPDPNQAAARLRDKVELLSEESIVKQAQGVEAFKQSPLNMLYLALGNESIASGKEVTAIIAEHEAKGTPSLSVAEFNAIADLNRRLRF